MVDIWFTSDLHFFHDNIRKYSNRPFDSIQEMNEILIKNWNTCVKPDDHIYTLGDIFLSKDRIAIDRICKRLNGKKFIVPGNHDKWIRHEQLTAHWEVLPALYDIQDHKQKIVMCHFPLLTWNKGSRGSWMLHGHCHASLNEMNEKTTRLDVGIDSAAKILKEYRPFHFDEVKTIMDKKTYFPVDHHGTRNKETYEKDEAYEE